MEGKKKNAMGTLASRDQEREGLSLDLPSKGAGFKQRTRDASLFFAGEAEKRKEGEITNVLGRLRGKKDACIL